MTLAQAVGVRLNNILKERGLSQYWLYKEGGITRSTIYYMINARKGAARLETLHQITSTLGISLKDFFDDPVFDEVVD